MILVEVYDISNIYTGGNYSLEARFYSAGRPMLLLPDSKGCFMSVSVPGMTVNIETIFYSRACSTNTYGAYCNETCNCVGGVCGDRGYGSCTECFAGYYGPFCERCTCKYGICKVKTLQISFYLILLDWD